MAYYPGFSTGGFDNPSLYAPSGYATPVYAPVHEQIYAAPAQQVAHIDVYDPTAPMVGPVSPYGYCVPREKEWSLGEILLGVFIAVVVLIILVVIFTGASGTTTRYGDPATGSSPGSQQSSQNSPGSGGTGGSVHSGN